MVKINKRYGCWVGLIILLGISLCIGGCVMVGGVTYSEGERTGEVLKFSYKGFPIKTWEGELVMRLSNPGMPPEVFQFSVSNPEVVAQVQNAQREGGKWTLHYKQQLFKQSWKGGTSYFITGVQKSNGE